MRLIDATRILRSKNAGPYHLTFDFFFSDASAFVAFTELWREHPRSLGDPLGVAPEDVHLETLPLLQAVKVTIPREHSAGSMEDLDVLGCQQMALLMDMSL